MVNKSPKLDKKMWINTDHLLPSALMLCGGDKSPQPNKENRRRTKSWITREKTSQLEEKWENKTDIRWDKNKSFNVSENL